ncbi:PREDICTED: calcium-dependent protein kinase 1 [Theobroma cacao]|uniref:Calcium-dependent protein kinase 1 n=1 Tax=Theobroma cacao TaxID=3641 RepID=A0AB32VCR9_THECC|nr:PREDICTED: calcium-dependent protein kinase 1 [Theobroma cacao]XP_017973315.1 PREDICTED: calcium-dependent protein kinase 1 [Theobroma cacao]
MEQFRQIGEVLGSLRALMVLQDEVQINRRQCCLLFDIFCLAFNTIAEEIRLNLKLEEKNTKWHALDHPLRELHKIFKEGELYVKQCMDKKDWRVKAIYLHQNKDCVDNHIHNLLCHFPVVIEAIETAGEIAGLDQDEMQRRRVALARKYDKEWNDPKLFQFRFGKQYLVPRDICSRFESAWREDRWNLVEALKEKKILDTATKNEQRLAGSLIKKIIGSEAYKGKLFPSSILYGGDYLVRRRLGAQYKEIQWLGDSFVLRHFFGEVEPSCSEISTLLSLSHPNILQYLCGFYDEEKKEVMLVLELMNKDLSCYMKENCGSRRRILFSFPVVVDLMLQIARGMEYLHSQKIRHGELNPSNIFLKARNNTEGFFHLKISGYGLSPVKTRSSPNSSPKPIEPNPFIWYAPEVLLEQEQPGNITISKYTEKADVYSFGMLCFQLLTGKVPFEDGHLQGEKMSRNIRAGERPLFPYTAPKYLVNLTKRCWHTDPNQRPSFSSISRILRYIKKYLVMNPDRDQPEMQSPVADYCEIEAWFLKKFTANGTFSPLSVAQIPFQMFAYRLAEKDKSILNTQDKNGELASEAASICRDENNSTVEDPLIAASETKSVSSDVKSVCSDIKSVYSDIRSVCSEIPERRSINFDTPQKRSISTKIPEKKKMFLMKKNTNVKAKNFTGTPNAQSPRPPTLNRGHSVRINRESRSPLITSSVSRGRQRAAAGHTSD